MKFDIASLAPLKVRCNLCHLEISSGSEKKRCSALRSYLTTHTHKMKVSFKLGADPVCVVMRDIDKIYQGQFLRKNSHAVCRDDRHAINLLRTCGDPLSRIVEHLPSSKQKAFAKKVQVASTKSIASYFQKQTSTALTRSGTSTDCLPRILPV